jgi:hypothetical protein
VTLAEAFEDHMKLAVRMRAGLPLRSSSSDPPNVPKLRAELVARELEPGFADAPRIDGYPDAKYAVDALLDAVIPEREAPLWVTRNGDLTVGHNYYEKMRQIYRELPSPRRTQLLEVYCLCDVLGFENNGFDLDRDDPTIKQANEEIDGNARNTEFPIGWTTERERQRDKHIYRANQVCRWLFGATIIAFVLGLFIVWLIRWVEF